MLPDKKNGFCFFEIDWLKLASIHCIQGYQFKWRGFSDEILTHLEILRHETRSLITPLHLTKMHAQYITFYTLHCSQLQSFYITGLAVKKVIFHSYRNATIKLEGICLEQLQFNFPLLDIKYCILIFWTKNCYHILLRIKYLNCFRIIITTNKIYYEDWILKDKKPKIVSGSFQTKNLRLREM